MIETQNICELHHIEMIPGEPFEYNGRSIPGSPSCSMCEAARREKALQEEAQAEADRFRQQQYEANVSRRYLFSRLSEMITDTAARQEIQQVATRFIKSNGTDLWGLLVIGPVGTGKTYLGTALVNEFLNAGRTAVYHTALGVIREFKSTWNPRGETEAQVFKKLVRKDLLVLDEVGVQFGSASEQAMLASLLDARYADRRPTVVIGNLTVKELTKTLGGRAIDRFREGGRVLIFDGPSRRGTMGNQTDDYELPPTASVRRRVVL